MIFEQKEHTTHKKGKLIKSYIKDWFDVFVYPIMPFEVNIEDAFNNLDNRIIKDIEEIIKQPRPIDYFKKHPFFSTITTDVIRIIGEEHANLFIEFAIYAVYSKYDEDVFIQTLKMFWKKEEISILSKNSMIQLYELVNIISYLRYDINYSNNLFYTPTFKYSTTHLNTNEIYPVDYYYLRRLREINLEGIAQNILNDFISTYKDYKEDKNPFKTLFDGIIIQNKAFSINKFDINVVSIYKERSNSIGFVYLIALAKACGIEMENCQIIKIIDIKLAKLFRNILWKCELYNNYKIGEHKLGQPNSNIKTATISTIVDNFSEKYFLVLKDYNPDPPKKYYVIKQEKRYDEFINLNFRENGEIFESLKNEIFVLWKKFGKKSKANTIRYIRDAAIKYKIFEYDPSFNEFNSIFKNLLSKDTYYREKGEMPESEISESISEKMKELKEATASFHK